MDTRLLDTDVVSFLAHNHTLATAYAPHLAGYTLAVSFQTVGELLEGAARADWGPARRASLETALRPFLIVYPDREVCERWAEVRAVRRIRPLPVADAWVAATALAYGLDLVTHSPADFAGIAGLVVVTEAS